MPQTLPDIQSALDIDQLVQTFYQQLLEDAIVGFLFTDIAKIDLDTHLPRVSQFWQQQLLGDSNYHGRTFEAHLHIHRRAELTEHHFHRWLYLFNRSIDTLFAGSTADMAKRRAKAIAHSMLSGLQDRHMSEILQARERGGLQTYDPSKSQDG